MDNSPPAAGPSVEASRPQTSSAPFDGRYVSHTILVTDDQASITETLRLIIASKIGCQVETADCAAAALPVLERGGIDVLVTDMVMPGLSGLDFVRRVRESSPDTDVIVMTGYTADFPFVDAIHAGASDFIAKPFQPGELEAKVLRILHDREARRARRIAEHKYRSLFELSTEGMALLLQDGYVIQEANQAFRELSGRGPEDLAGVSVLDLLDEQDRARLEQWLGFCAISGKGTIADLTLLHPDGKARSLDISVTFVPLEMNPALYMAFRDVTERREVDRQLADAAQRDALTGLSNKRSFQNRIEWAVNQAHERKLPLALLLIDLDNFKRCNDTHGHQVGDRLLEAIGEVVNKSIRATRDEGFRLGGDEFAVILIGASLESSQRVAERLQSEFSKIETYGTSMSIGIAEFQADHHVETFIRAADEALYRAKAAGKNTIEVA